MVVGRREWMKESQLDLGAGNEQRRRKVRRKAVVMEGGVAFVGPACFFVEERSGPSEPLALVPACL